MREGFAVVDVLLQLRVGFGGLAECFERGKSSGGGSVECFGDLDRRDLSHGLMVDETMTPIADAEDVCSRHGAALHKLLNGVKAAAAFMMWMTPAGLREPLEVDIAPKEAGDERHHL